MASIRDAMAAEAPVLEALQRRSSDMWPEYREALAANPDAIELPHGFIDSGWVRVTVDHEDAPTGFSVVIPGADGAHELDGLFVEPARMRCGTGRALVADAVARASARGAECLEVTAGPAQGFYQRVGFRLVGTAQTRFGPAVRMRHELQPVRSDEDTSCRAKAGAGRLSEARPVRLGQRRSACTIQTLGSQ